MVITSRFKTRISMTHIFTCTCILSSWLLSSASVHAEDDSQKKLNIAFTFSLPPYLNADHQSGVEYEIIAAALNAAGLSVDSVVNVHYRRAMQLIEQGSIDAIVSNLNNHSYDSLSVPLYPSKTTLSYVDCAITKASRNIKLDTVDDYQELSIWAFKSASEVLGRAFKDMTQKNPNYTEDYNQSLQTQVLSMGRIDVAISDRNIFVARIDPESGLNKADFHFHPITDPTPRTLRFAKADLAEQFNRGLQMLKNNGQYTALLEKHAKQYHTRCE